MTPNQYQQSEAIAEIAYIMGQFDFRPPDSRTIFERAISWGVQFDKTYNDNVKSGTWHEDEYIERIDEFTYGRLRDLREHCNRPPQTWDTIAKAESFVATLVAENEQCSATVQRS